MSLLALPFPAIDPVAIELGPIAIRWYGLAYLAGLLLGWRLTRWLVTKPPRLISPQQLDDFLVWAILGVVLGGRLGSILFYSWERTLEEPLSALRIWEGGMAFHGGLLGVILAIWLFARRHGIPFFALTDVVAVATPIGLFFGRVANFINGELWGRPTDLPWAMVFPGAGTAPRHPSQLYEAGLEGLLLFVVLLLLVRRGWLERLGALSGVFLSGYALARILVEFVREPDAHIGYLAGLFTMGQVLSLPMLALGLYLIARSGKGPASQGGP